MEQNIGTGAFRVTCKEHGTVKVLQQRNKAIDDGRLPSRWCEPCSRMRRMPRAPKPQPAGEPVRCDVCTGHKTNTVRVTHPDTRRHLNVCATCLPTKKGRRMVDRMFAEQFEARRRLWKELSKAERDRIKAHGFRSNLKVEDFAGFVDDGAEEN